MPEGEKASTYNSSHHEVLAVIPTLGTDLDRLNAVIRSVREHSNRQDYYLVVVDNSKLGNLDGIQGVDEIVRSGINLGWVGSLEVVRRSYQFKYLWTLQDDMLILNDVLKILKRDLDLNPTRGVSSPVTINNGMIPSFSMGAVMEDSESLKWSSIPKVPTKPAEVEIPTNLCSVYGSGALWRGEALAAAGGFGLHLFPVVHVDVDMCLSLVREGWTLMILSDAHVDHARRGSTNTLLWDALYIINTELIREKLNGTTIETQAAKLEIDKDIIFEIAAKSTHLIFDVSRLGSERLAQWQARPWLNAFLSSALFRNLDKRYVMLQNSPNAFLRKLTATTASGLKIVLRMGESKK